MKTFISNNYQWIKNLYLKHERLLMSVMLVSGFLFDFVAFVNIDIIFKFTVLVFYWLLSGGVIAFMQAYDGGKISLRFQYVRLFVPLVLQFTFGGLLNISLIFYWFSGAFSVSWPFIIAIALLLYFNDTFRHQFSKPLVQISVYFFITFSLFSLILPFWLASLSAWLFVASGAFSLIIFVVYIYGLSVFNAQIKAQKIPLFASVVCILVVMNILYFTNIIPPIPLAVREAGLYHNINSSGLNYVMSGEAESFWQNLQSVIFGQTVHVTGSEKIYLYNAIFAPANLKTTIVHQWQYYDVLQGKWVDRGNLNFTINGGRQEGYKGYSWQSNLNQGSWRVYVKNPRGQVLAKVIFKVENVAIPVQLQQFVR